MNLMVSNNEVAYVTKQCIFVKRLSCCGDSWCFIRCLFANDGFQGLNFMLFTEPLVQIQMKILDVLV